MENNNNNISSYFLNLKLDDTEAAYKSLLRLGLKPLFGKDSLDKLKEAGMNEKTFLINDKKVWGWDIKKADDNFNNITLTDLTKILGLPPANKIPTLEIDELLKNRNDNYYYLMCDAPAVDNKHQTDLLMHLGLISGEKKEEAINYFKQFKKSEKPVVFTYHNKIWNLSGQMDQKELGKLGIQHPVDLIPKFKLSELLKKQHEDLEFLDYNSLESLPDYRKTESICEKAVRVDPYNIRHIPDYMLSDHLIVSAVCCEGMTIEFVPNELHSDELYKKAIENSEGQALQLIPKEKRSYEMCLSAVEKDGYQLQFVPQILRTPEICLMAVIKNKELETEVPDSVKNNKEINLYRFGVVADKKVDQKLTYNQLKDLYEGKTLTIKDKVSDTGTPQMVNINYNQAKNTLDYRFPPQEKNHNIFKNKYQSILPVSKKRL